MDVRARALPDDAVLADARFGVGVDSLVRTLASFARQPAASPPPSASGGSDALRMQVEERPMGRRQ